MSTSNDNPFEAGPLQRAYLRRLPHWAESRAVRTFHAAARRVPAYAQILAEHDVTQNQVRDIEGFRRHVPFTDKDSTFARFPLKELCEGGRLPSGASIYTSSGYSGVFSFGTETGVEQKRIRRGIDGMLDLYFRARHRRTLVINALPAGVRVPTRLANVADTGPRPDAALAVLRSIAPDFEQTVLVAEPPMLKQTVELGTDANIPWGQRELYMVTGGEFVPESFRDYLAGLMDGGEPGESVHRIFISYGISELGVSIAQETPESRWIRRLAHTNPELRHRLFGDTPVLPALLQYDPSSIYLETAPGENDRPELIATTLGRRRIPLIRYRTGDWCEIREPNSILATAGRQDAAPSASALLPFLTVWGRLKPKPVRHAPPSIEQAPQSDGLAYERLAGSL